MDPIKKTKIEDLFLKYEAYELFLALQTLNPKDIRIEEQMTENGEFVKKLIIQMQDDTLIIEDFPDANKETTGQ